MWRPNTAASVSDGGMDCERSGFPSCRALAPGLHDRTLGGQQMNSSSKLGLLFGASGTATCLLLWGLSGAFATLNFAFLLGGPALAIPVVAAAGIGSRRGWLLPPVSFGRAASAALPLCFLPI